MTFYAPRNIGPADQVLFDADGNAVGIQPAGSSSPPVLGFNPTTHAAVSSLVSGGGISVAPSFLGAYGSVTMDAGSGGVMPTMGVVVNAATDVIAAQQIDDAGVQAFLTTIDGNSSHGEVMILTTGSTPITSLHIGHSTGTGQTLSSDSTITVSELVKFTFDAADGVTSVRITFSPPRSSGRYIDVHCVGQQVSA